MKVTQKEAERFMQAFKWVGNRVAYVRGEYPTTLEILATIMVMDDNDPAKLVELLREMEKEKNE